MAYNRVNWEDAPSTKTPISAENLNKMDAGILANDTKLKKAISIKQEAADDAEDVENTLIGSLPAATAAEDTDIMILENATKTQKVTWGTILNLIKTKLGIGTAADLTTTNKEIVGAVNELNSNMVQTISISSTTDDSGKITVDYPISKIVGAVETSQSCICLPRFYNNSKAFLFFYNPYNLTNVVSNTSVNVKLRIIN